MLKDQIEDSLIFDDVFILPVNSKFLPSEASEKNRISQQLGCKIKLLSTAIVKFTKNQMVIYMA